MKERLNVYHKMQGDGVLLNLIQVVAMETNKAIARPTAGEKWDSLM